MAFSTEESFIERAEALLGRAFPAEYRGRLLADNGGEIEDDGGEEWQLFPVRDDSDRRRLSRTASDVVRETEAARQWPGFPADAVAIASAGTGDFLVLPAGSDEVHFWDHETGQMLPHPVYWE